MFEVRGLRLEAKNKKLEVRGWRRESCVRLEVRGKEIRRLDFASNLKWLVGAKLVERNPKRSSNLMRNVGFHILIKDSGG
jgi:hypothetical protein